MFPNLSTGAIGVKATLTEAIDYAKQYGFAGVDFSISEAKTFAEQHSVDQLRSLFAQANVVPGGWGLPVDFRKDDATWRSGLEALPAQANLARQLGCLRCTTWIMPCDDERNFATNWRFHVNRLRPIAEILSDYGVRLGLEFVGPKTLRMPRRYDFVHTLDGLLGLAAAIDTGNVGVMLDSYHLYTAHDSVDSVRRLHNQDVVYVHVNDALAGKAIDEQLDLVRALPGATGVLDLAGFIDALKSIGYDGPVTAEPFDKALAALPPAQAVEKTSAALQTLRIV